jgi:hypothetical protein
MVLLSTAQHVYICMYASILNIKIYLCIYIHTHNTYKNIHTHTYLSARRPERGVFLVKVQDKIIVSSGPEVRASVHACKHVGPRIRKRV